jgi:hypothetical protein
LLKFINCYYDLLCLTDLNRQPSSYRQTIWSVFTLEESIGRLLFCRTERRLSMSRGLCSDCLFERSLQHSHSHHPRVTRSMKEVNWLTFALLFILTSTVSRYAPTLEREDLPREHDAVEWLVSYQQFYVHLATWLRHASSHGTLIQLRQDFHLPEL